MELELLRLQILDAIAIIDDLIYLDNQLRTSIKILDVKAKPQYINPKGIQVEGIIMISVEVKYGKKFKWKKAYGFLPKDLKKFTIDDFKERLYRESRVWIKESELQEEALGHLNASKNEVLYLD